MAKDYSKYVIEGVAENLGKSKLALAIIENYVSNNSVDFDILNAAFPDECQGGIHGVFRKKEDVKDFKRYYMNMPIKLIDGSTIVVTNQWGIDNIPGLIERAEKLGFKIESKIIKPENKPASEDSIKIDFRNIDASEFKKLITDEIENNNDDAIIAIYNSLIDYLNADEKNRSIGWYVILFIYTLNQNDWEVDYDINKLTYNINKETFFVFNPERQDEDGWESTSDFIWTDSKTGAQGSFLELLLKRLNITNIDNSLLDENLTDAAVTYFWFSMVNFILSSKIHDEDELTKLMWTVFEDPFHSNHSEIDFCGETPGANAMNIIINDLLGYEYNHFNCEENDEMEPYGDYMTDYTAVAKDILTRDIFDDILLND
jgi:hypothetical protein